MMMMMHTAHNTAPRYKIIKENCYQIIYTPIDGNTLFYNGRWYIIIEFTKEHIKNNNNLIIRKKERKTSTLHYSLLTFYTNSLSY